MCSRRLLTLGGSIAVGLLVAGSALAQLTKDEQKCLDGYNNKLRLVGQQAGKDYRKCVKDAGKGKVADAEACVASDSPGKIAGKEAKVTDLYTSGKCTGSEPIQQGAATGNAAMVGSSQDLVHDVFGDPIAGVVSPGKPEAKCQDKGYQRSEQAFTEILKAQRKCKKNGMKSNAITDEASLKANCGTFAQIDGASGGGGKAAAKLAKISTDVTAACAGLGLPALFQGESAGCTASTTALGLCLQQDTRCRACEALNAADGTDIDCDLFDDATANGSCGGIPLGSHACTLAPTSSLTLGTASLALPLVPSGSLSINCGVPDGNNDANCSCAVTSFNVIVIAALGDVCVNPAPGCLPGTVDCDGGTTQDVQLVSNHKIGTCTGDTDCQTQCDTYCGGLAPMGSFARISYGCEGFCQGGSAHGMACTSDTQCPGGQCSGGEPVAHGGTCQCNCQAEGLGGASGAGSLSCQVGTQINVENVGAPSGACGDAAPTIVLPPVCGAVTTTTAVGGILNANNAMGVTLPPYGLLTNPPGIGTYPNSLSGAGISCASLSTSTTTGLTLVGHLGFADSTLGDILSINKFVCQ